MAFNPNTFSVDLGRVPKNRGTYISGTHYYKDNIVQYQGSSFIANPTSANDYHDGNDGTAQAPEWYLTRTPFETDPNTPRLGWEVFATGKHNFSTGEDIDDVGITDVVDTSSNLVKSSGVEAVTYITRDLLESAEILDKAVITNEYTSDNNNPPQYTPPTGKINIDYTANNHSNYTVYKIKNQKFTTVYGYASGPSDMKPVVVFCSEDDTILSCVKPHGATSVHHFVNIAVPEGCAYIYVEKYMNLQTECTTYTDVAKRVTGIEGDINDLADSTEESFASVGNLADCVRVPLNKTNYVILASNGIEYTDTDPEHGFSAFGISGYIPVTPGSTITIVKGVRQPGNASYAYGAFYSNTTGNEDSCVSTLVNGELSVEIVDKVLTVPSTASYMKVCLNSRNLDAFIVKGKTLSGITKEIILTNTDSAKYYAKGNSNIIYSPTKNIGIIAAGQSNIDGRDPYQEFPYLQEDADNIVEHDNVTELVYNNVKTKKALETGFQPFKIRKTVTSDPPVYDTQHPGYNWSFDAVVYRLLTNPNYGNQDNIYVMKKSLGGTSIDKDGSGGGGDYHWTADYEFLDSEDNSLLRSFESIIREGVDTDGGSFDIKALLWCQGEGDSNTQQTADKYYTNLKNMFAYIRGIVCNPRLHIFCSNASEMPRTGQLGHAFVTTINEAYDRLAAEDPYLHVVDMRKATYRFDHLHFDSAWSTYLGQMVYDMMIDAGLVTGTKVNPTPPQPSV